MNQSKPQAFQLDRPPIIEAIVDIDCDLPPGTDLSELEPKAKASLQASYPQSQKKMLHQFQIRKETEVPSTHSLDERLDALLFRSEDGRQLTQFRRSGYSFNRLAPYRGMDTYLPEIRKTWENYCSIARPLRIRKIGLRTINRILLPLEDGGGLDLGRYLLTAPKVPKVEGRELSFTGFLDQQQVVDAASGQRTNIILATKEAHEGKLAVLLDIDAYDPRFNESLEWPAVEEVIKSLRTLKNDLFHRIVTPECLTLFSDPQS